MSRLKFTTLFGLFVVFEIVNGEPCLPSMFTCSSGQCVNYTSICNNINDCIDGSDELDCGPLCPEGWFHCTNGNCMLKRWQCDGENDCGDGSDELNCGQIVQQCAHGEFRCHDNKKCISLSWVCDGHGDCQDESDETPGCVLQGPCDKFLCANKRECLPKRWRCDGRVDCKDASDEFNCTGPGNVPCLEDNLQFFCDDRLSCIERELVCNGVLNCHDGSDEGGLCEQHSCKQAGCSHNCFQTPKKHICYCPKGYKLPTNTSICQDINECVDGTQHPCSHDCHNILGSYSCSCKFGYRLKPQEDSEIVNHECEAEDPEPILIYSASRELKVIKLRTGLVYSLQEHLNHAVGVDYDSVEDRIYWTEISEGSEAIKSCNLDGNDVQIIVSTGINVVEDVAVDWVAHNLYFTDSGLMRLAVCNKGGSFCKVLINDIRQPRALIVESSTGLMYWSDWSHTPLIESSEMDGSNRRVLVSTGLGWPNGLAIDHALQRLYWLDAKLGRIEYVSLEDPSQRQFVFEQMMLHPFAFAVFEDTFYWTDWSRHTLESCNKFTGENHKILVKEEGDNIPMGVHVYHPLTQSVTNNPCWVNNCQQLCLLTANNKHACACASGFKLAADKKSCVGVDRTRLLISVEDTVYEFLEPEIGKSGLVALQMKAKTVIGAITYNPILATILYSDLGSKEIISFDLISSSQKVLISSHLGTVESLDLDWISGNLYWVDVEKQTVEVCRMDGSSRKVLVGYSPDHPMDIVVVPNKGYMFVSVFSSRPRIEKMDMDGSDRHIFIDFELHAPMSLAVDYKNELLYWTNSKEGKVEWATFDGKHRYIMDKYIGRPKNVAKANGVVMWTDISDGLQLWMFNESIASMKVDHLQSDLSYAKMTSITHLLVINSAYPKDANTCKIGNGGCSHLCLVNQKSKVCACPDGLTLETNKRSCTLKLECSLDDFKCSDGKCISMSSTCDGFTDCENGADETGCKPECSLSEFQCGDGACIPKRWVCDRSSHCRDGSDEKNCKYTSCLPGSFSCVSDGACIADRWRCDGQADCSDQSDEKNCPQTTCPSNYFRCNTSHCIPESWQCDMEMDCRDGSDEDGCEKSTKDCRSIEFKCSNERCISMDLVCDHEDDCGDGSDESQNCDILLCPTGMFKCSDNRCIMQKTICDGVPDCLTGEDEKNCQQECKSNEFKCLSDGSCILSDWICDGDYDCIDQSDEHLDECHSNPENIMDESVIPIFHEPGARAFATNDSVLKGQAMSPCLNWMEYLCQSGECISIHDLCNHKNNCRDHSDEGAFCSSVCENNGGGCSDLCVPAPKGPICKCRSGYDLDTDSKTCFDIDECLFTGACSQRCFNVPGTFVCTCASGYTLRSDHRSCKAEGPTPELIYALSTKVLSSGLGSNHVNMITHKEDSSIESVDFDWKQKEIYWIDSYKETINKYSMTTKTETVVMGYLKSPKVMAIDWISRLLLFWERKGNENLIICTLDGKYCADGFLMGSATVGSLIIDACHGTLFWSTWSTSVGRADGTIERSLMNGKRRAILTSQKMVWPVGLTLDHLHNDLYWADGHRQVIETMNTDGHNRRVVTHSNLNYPMSLTIFEDLLFWADWGTNTIKNCDKLSCESHLEIFKEHVIKVNDMIMFHPVQQPNGSNDCVNSNRANCSHICIPTATGFSCLCPHGMTFTDHTNTTCLHVNSSSTIDLNKFGVCRDKKKCFNGGRCVLTSEGKEVCRCTNGFSGVRCEIKDNIAYQSKDVMGRSTEKKENHGMIAGVIIGIIFVLVAAMAAVFYCRRFGPQKFRNPFSHIPLRNQLFEENEEQMEDAEDDACYNNAIEESYKSYSNPMYCNTRVEIDMNKNENDSKVKFHVVESSASLDSDFTSESGSTLIDYRPTDQICH